MEQLSTLELIGTQYLDTQHSADYIERRETELADRGIVGVRRWILEYIAASSLWWNIFWWDWVNLDDSDVRLGWGQNVAIFAVAFIGMWWMANLLWAAAAVLVLHLGMLWIGLGLRRGSAPG